MRRSTWVAVLVTTLVLAGAGTLPRLATLAAIAPGVARAAWIPAGLAVLAALAALVGRARDPRRRLAARTRRVLVLAREGRDAAGIARASGLSQDAVRTLLRPAVARGRPRHGVEFR